MRYSRLQVLNTPIERIPRPTVLRFFTSIDCYGRVASSDTTPHWGKAAGRLYLEFKYPTAHLEQWAAPKEQFRSLIYYIAEWGNTSDKAQFLQHIAAKANNYQEDIMTIAEQLEARGIEKGIRLGRQEGRREGEHRPHLKLQSNLLPMALNAPALKYRRACPMMNLPPCSMTVAVHRVDCQIVYHHITETSETPHQGKYASKHLRFNKKYLKPLTLLYNV